MKQYFFVALAILALTSEASARPRHHRHHARASAGEVVAHPAGCPRALFCGCGAAVKLFGRPVRELWAARSWFKFPRSAPAPMTAAVRAHHVFVLLEHVQGPVWRVYDANSGGRKTRVHLRSIAGFTIVNPRGAA